MSITYRTEGKIVELNAYVSLKHMECSEEYYRWTERSLVSKDGRIIEAPQKGERYDEGDFYVYTEDCIIFYHFKDEYVSKKEDRRFLVITMVVDLNEFRIKEISEKEKLRLFKEMYEQRLSSDEYAEDINIIEFTPDMERKRVFFRVPSTE